MSDEAREARIKELGQKMTADMRSATWHGEAYFNFRGSADRARMEMEELIRQRSPEFVAQMERERGLA
jgi:hypothetical protein